MYIAIDFDGTCVTHDFPEVGKNIGAVPVLKELVKKGHKLILNTMRSKKDAGNVDENGNKLNRDVLKDAEDWFKENSIELCGVNHNPTQDSWTTSSETFAHLYIDDAALGAPLKSDIKKSERLFIDWLKVLWVLTRDFDIFSMDEYYRIKEQISAEYYKNY